MENKYAYTIPHLNVKVLRQVCDAIAKKRHYHVYHDKSRVSCSCLTVQTFDSCRVDQTSASAWLYKPPWITCQKNKPSTPMTHVACESKLRSVVKSSMHPCPGNWVAIGRAVVYHGRAAHTFSTGTKYRHCIYQL